MKRFNLKILGSAALLLVSFNSSHCRESRIIQQVVQPTAIVWQSDSTGKFVESAESLLASFPGQVSVNNSSQGMIMRNSGGHVPSVLLDFGKELYGSVKIYTGMAEKHNAKHLRVCFGESVTEAMSNTDIVDNPQNPTNEHSARDYVVSVPWLGSLESGKTGFRFVRIDFVDPDDEIAVPHVEAIMSIRDLDDLGSFECSDKKITDIWNTGAYTVKLAMQDYIWDGVKRDRLVWLGDMHPEIMTICNVWGDVDVVGSTLDFAKEDTPLPGWINGMCSYSLWWMIIQNDYNRYTGNDEYLKQQVPYISGLVEQIAKCVDDKGIEHLDGVRFLDWPTSENEKTIHRGLQSLTVMALEAAAEIGAKVNDNILADKAATLAKKMKKVHIDNDGSKQAAALAIISGMSDNVKRDVDTILKGGPQGFSTFYGYYMLEALAKAGYNDEAMKLMSDYWGAMLDLGATTFWEDLDYKDVANAAPIDKIVPKGKYDIHAGGGAYCYKGLRLSLCHGWASGPTSWLTAHVLGLKPLNAGCSVVEVNPCLGDLAWAKGTFPTPKGNISVSVTKDASGKTIASVVAPQGIEVINRTTPDMAASK